MDVIIWILIIALFILSFVGLLFPILPSALLIVAAFFIYGICFSFSQLTISFWVVESMFIILLFLSDYLANMVGVKRFGGSKAAGWGSTIGLIAGPFIIPFVGIILGPFLGAVAAELLVHRKTFSEAVKVGVGSLLGLLASTVAKGLIQLLMIIHFLYIIF
ncbi:MAG: DUF456 domain-containing protein [Bacillaceae bacterium]|nr:MAG: DUF456 domain-containing protein [Bacillaceae bacterium]